VEPGRELGALLVGAAEHGLWKVRRALRQPEEGLLDDVLVGGALSEESAGQAQESALMAAHELGESLAVPCPPSQEQATLRCLGHLRDVYRILERAVQAGSWAFFRFVVPPLGGLLFFVSVKAA
jgi:hypothetical protein